MCLQIDEMVPNHRHPQHVDSFLSANLLVSAKMAKR